MKQSPTSRSLAYMRAPENGGYLAEVVERWNPHARIRQDLWGIIDILGVTDQPGFPPVLAVQTTTRGEVSRRLAKIAASPNIGTLRKAGVAIHVHGWGKLKAGWTVRIEDVS